MRLFDMDSREDYLLDGRYKVATPYAPCVDVVEVVRCEDCRFWNHKTDLTYCSKKTWLGTDAEDYCSFGERVVRCKQCRHFEAINNDDHGWCKLISDFPCEMSIRYDDDFCSYGERAEV